MSKIIILDEEAAETMITRIVQKAFNLHPTLGKGAVEEYLLKPQAADFLNVSESTLNRYLADGTIAFIKRSRRVYFRLSDLRAFLENGRKKPRDEILDDLKTLKKTSANGAH